MSEKIKPKSEQSNPGPSLGGIGLVLEYHRLLTELVEGVAPEGANKTEVPMDQTSIPAECRQIIDQKGVIRSARQQCLGLTASSHRRFVAVRAVAGD